MVVDIFSLSPAIYTGISGSSDSDYCLTPLAVCILQIASSAVRHSSHCLFKQQFRVTRDVFHNIIMMAITLMAVAPHMPAKKDQLVTAAGRNISPIVAVDVELTIVWWCVDI